MYQIRQGVFETNSSSTHSLCICTKKEYEDFKDGKLSYNYYGDRLEDCNIPSNYMNRAKEYYEKKQDLFYARLGQPFTRRPKKLHDK